MDAPFTTWKEMRSQTSVVMFMSTGAIYSILQKHKRNTKSSTKADLVGVDKVMLQMIRMRNFLPC
jgi:hypothetical protein